MKDTKTYKRNCPNCNIELTYISKGNRDNANKKKCTCKSCFYNRQKNRKMSDEQKEQISKTLLGRKKSKETRKKMSESRIGKIGPRIGMITSSDTKTKMRISAIKRVADAKFNGNQWKPNYNPSSISIIEQKSKEFGITDLQHAENGGEYYIQKLGYWVDGYSKEKNIVIEYYEKNHNRQVVKDLERKKEIENLLKCKFIIIHE